MKLRNIYFCAAFLLAALTLTAFSVSAQNESDSDDNYCSNNWSWNGKVSARDSREFTIPIRNNLEVDGKQNGGITVRGENRSDILIRACVVAWRDSEAEAESAVKQIKIKTDSVIEAEIGDDKQWAVSYQILVPKNTDLKLSANNGGISVNSVAGTMDFFTKNGGLSLRDLSGSVTGKTQNGGVSIELSGSTWIGSGLDIETKNGGVKLSLPENYAANIETGTRNGGFKSEIAELQIEGKKKWYNNRISKNLNGGGAPVRIITTNGGIKIAAR